MSLINNIIDSVVLIPVASSNDIVDEEPCVDSVVLIPVASSNDIVDEGHCVDSVVLQYH
jgi:hypothetical protein